MAPTADPGPRWPVRPSTVLAFLSALCGPCLRSRRRRRSTLGTDGDETQPPCARPRDHRYPDRGQPRATCGLPSPPPPTTTTGSTEGSTGTSSAVPPAESPFPVNHPRSSSALDTAPAARNTSSPRRPPRPPFAQPSPPSRRNETQVQGILSAFTTPLLPLPPIHRESREPRPRPSSSHLSAHSNPSAGHTRGMARSKLSHTVHPFASPCDTSIASSAILTSVFPSHSHTHPKSDRDADTNTTLPPSTHTHVIAPNFAGPASDESLPAQTAKQHHRSANNAFATVRAFKLMSGLGPLSSVDACLAHPARAGSSLCFEAGTPWSNTLPSSTQHSQSHSRRLSYSTMGFGSASDARRRGTSLLPPSVGARDKEGKLVKLFTSSSPSASAATASSTLAIATSPRRTASSSPARSLHGSSSSSSSRSSTRTASRRAKRPKRALNTYNDSHVSECALSSSSTLTERKDSARCSPPCSTVRPRISLPVSVV